MDQQQITSLVKQLTDAAEAYYNGHPIMSDAKYDALEDELRKADPTNTFFKRVGATAPVGGAWPKITHDIPMGSLNKAQDINDLAAWFKSCSIQPGNTVMVTEKLDGISIALRYENRKLVQGVTRGDGETGEDITRNVLLMQGAVKVLPPKWDNGTVVPDLVFVRGEIVCLKSDFAKHFKGESNPRNTASGTSKRQSNHEKCRHLTIKAYQLLPDGEAPESKTDEMRNLEHAGFQVSNWIRCVVQGNDFPNSSTITLWLNVENVYQGYVDGKRDSLDYDIDGLVVEIDETSTREDLGLLHHRPKGAVAFKFPHEKKPTVLRSIRWQVGNSGRITPVAEFDVVSLAGANVKQASLHNISNINDLWGKTVAPAKGDTIMVSRRNDVIPYVEEVLSAMGQGTAFHVPTECPACKGTLERDGEYLVCRNDDCEAQATGAIKRWVKKIGVLHVGGALIEALVEAGMVSDPADLYTLNKTDVEDLDMGGRRVGGTGTKAIRNLEAKMTMPLHVIVGSLGIDMIGRTMAKTIVDGGFDSLSKLLKARISEVAAIPGVGQTKATNFVHGFTAKAGLVAKLLSNGIQIQDVSGPLVGQSFCLTGFRDPALQDAIEKAGGTIKSGVSKALTTLITLDPNSTSGKANKARKYGTDIISPDDAWKLVGGRP